MKLTFKLYATLAERLPPDANDHAVVIDVPDDTSVHDLVDRFNVPRKSAHLVLRNGLFVAPEDRDRPLLKDGDTLAIWPPVAGG